MQQRDWFQLGTRLLGLWLMVGVADQVLNLFNVVAIAGGPAVAMLMLGQLVTHLEVGRSYYCGAI